MDEGPKLVPQDAIKQQKQLNKTKNAIQ
jgi:hypothetical protein